MKLSKGNGTELKLFGRSELGQDSRREERIDAAESHHSFQNNEKYWPNSPVPSKAKKWLISALQLRQRSTNAMLPRRALKSSHFLTSQTDSNSAPLPRGFTLIELIVVMAVFLFIIGAAIGIFLSVVQNQKRVLSEQEFLNQISYAEEYMSKALRMATTDISGSCLGSGNAGYIYLLTRYDTGLVQYKGIKFINQTDINASGNATCEEFFLDNTDPKHPVLKELKDSTNDADAVALTPSSLQINSARFSINGSDGSAKNCTDPNQCGASTADTVQPKVTILLNVNIPGGASTTIQTTVSQRNLNVK